MTIEYIFNNEVYEFEIDFYDLKKAVETILKRIAKVKDGENDAIERLMRFFIDEIDIFNNDDFIEYIKEDLQEYFQEDAYEAYQNAVDLEELDEDLRRLYSRQRM